MQGCFEIITLNGSFVYHTMYPHRKLGKLSIQLADADGTVFGGPVLPGAPLIAASPIQVSLTSFIWVMLEVKQQKIVVLKCPIILKQMLLRPRSPFE